MRPLWKGSISFGLVNIPVGLYSAINRQEAIDLDLLRDSDHSRIRYRKVAEADGQEVPLEHIVKGYEYEKGSYVVLKPQDFERVEIKSSQMVDIKEFVKLDDIDPRFFNQPYFLAPEKNGTKAYVLLKTALEKTGLAGVAKVVIRPPREHLALLKPVDGILLLEPHWHFCIFANAASAVVFNLPRICSTCPDPPGVVSYRIIESGSPNSRKYKLPSISSRRILNASLAPSNNA